MFENDIMEKLFENMALISSVFHKLPEELFPKSLVKKKSNVK
jgi:hypothetical protein